MCVSHSFISVFAVIPFVLMHRTEMCCTWEHISKLFCVCVRVCLWCVVCVCVCVLTLTSIFLRSCDRASWQILIIEPTTCTNFSNLFSNKTLHVLDSSFVHHQEFFTSHTAMVYVIQVCRQLASRIRMEQSSILILLASFQQTFMTHIIAVFTVKNSWWWTEELSETCRVSFQE